MLNKVITPKVSNVNLEGNGILECVKFIKLWLWGN
jgi:hypothetical protein